jgi:hypothetical protein
MIESFDFHPLKTLTEIRALLDDRVELEGSGNMAILRAGIKRDESL